MVICAVRAFSQPDHHEIACSVSSHFGGKLGARRVGVDLELPSYGCAVGGVTLHLDAAGLWIRTVRTVAFPGNHEVALGVHGHCGERLTARCIGIDWKLITQGNRFLCQS